MSDVAVPIGFSLSRFLDKVSRFDMPEVTLSPTPNYLPGSPESIAFDISSVEEDIKAWETTIEISLSEMAKHLQEIEVCRDDVARGRDELAKLHAKMKVVDRRIANDCKIAFRDRRRAADSLSGVTR